MNKDIIWKDYFGDNARSADIINGLGCDGIQVVSPNDLEEVDTSEATRMRDMIRKTAFGANFALVGIENQETVDYGISLRMLSYDVSRYQKQSKKIKNK